jgi:hypothetical protein
MQDKLGYFAGDALGSSVDISSDGSHIVAGAPGDIGYAIVYEFDGSVWNEVFVAQGDVSGEAFASSVKFLSPDGSVLAVGSPGYGGEDGQGRVVVYQKDSTGNFSQLGPTIVGGPNEKFGAANKLAGGGATPSVIIGTAANGEVKRFAFDSSSNAWQLKGSPVVTGYSEGLAAVASSSDSNAFAAGGSLDAGVYELQ